MIQALLKHIVYWDFILGKYASYADFDKKSFENLLL